MKAMYNNEGVEQMSYNLYQPKIVREQVTSTHNILVVIETNTVGEKYKVCFPLSHVPRMVGVTGQDDGW